MERITLSAKTREANGTRVVRRMRRSGFVPGIVYGHGMKPLAFQVAVRDLFKIMHTKAGENVIIDLQVENTKLKESTCRIQDIQHNPVTEEIQHVDLAVISMTERMKVKVPLFATHMDESEGLKMGGILDMVHHELEVECLPMAIPQKFEVNIKGLKIGQAIHVKDLQFPDGVVPQLPQDEVLVAVHALKEEEVATPAEGAEAATPEVIEKGKKVEAEEGAAPAAAAPAAKVPAAKK